MEEFVTREENFLEGYLALYAKVFLIISTVYSTAFVIWGSLLKIWDKIQALV